MKQIPQNLQGDSIKQFLKGFHSEATKESYCKKLSQFVDFCNMLPDQLLEKHKHIKKSLHTFKQISYVECVHNPNYDS